MKALRDALWQAAIESEAGTDPYTLPLEDIVERLRSAKVIADADADTVATFVQEYDNDEPAAVPDELETEIARIVAGLRSIR